MKEINKNSIKSKKDLPTVPILFDMIQESTGNLEIPEIRVWCHPHKDDQSGEDYYMVFDTFKNAMNFIDEQTIAERQPLIAFRGFEINIFELPNVTREDNSEDRT